MTAPITELDRIQERIESLDVITKTFESLIVDIAEGKVTLEEAFVDTGLYRTVLKLSVRPVSRLETKCTNGC